jgi:hypothetical protein
MMKLKTQIHPRLYFLLEGQARMMYRSTSLSIGTEPEQGKR